MLATSLLHWLHRPTFVAEEVVLEMKALFLDAIKIKVKPSRNIIKLSESEIITAVRKSNFKIHNAVELIYVHSKIVESETICTNWLMRSIHIINENMKYEMCLFLQTLMLQSNDCENLKKDIIFDILLGITHENNSYAFGLLATTIYAMKIAKDPSEMLMYIKGIPRLAVAKVILKKNISLKCIEV